MQITSAIDRIASCIYYPSFRFVSSGSDLLEPPIADSAHYDPRYGQYGVVGQAVQCGTSQLGLQGASMTARYGLMQSAHTR
jgi:hypothetical protein